VRSSRRQIYTCHAQGFEHNGDNKQPPKDYDETLLGFYVALLFV
jgi:hypothetical protein